MKLCFMITIPVRAKLQELVQNEAQGPHISRRRPASVNLFPNFRRNVPRRSLKTAVVRILSQHGDFVPYVTDGKDIQADTRVLVRIKILDFKYKAAHNGSTMLRPSLSSMRGP